MFTNLEIDILKRAPEKDKNIFLRKLRTQVNKEIHLKIEQDDMPRTYLLKEVGKDCIVVHFANVQRIIPLNRIVFFQIDMDDNTNGATRHPNGQ